MTYSDEKSLVTFFHQTWTGSRGFESAEALKNRSDSITIELLGLETSFLYFRDPYKVQNLLNVKIFMYNVIDGSVGYKP